MEKKIELTIQDILEKEFHIDLKGYCANEVDSFLDLVINDYQKYEEMITNLGESLRRYEEESQQLRNKISQLEAKAQNNEVPNAPVENLDIIKRLSKLEQEVFRNK